EIKLPTLSLPTFSGVIDEWLTFSDLFQAAVTNNQNLTGAQKLQYLKGVLKGDAQKIVQSLPITDGNFQIAWDLLKERYFHKREILNSLMKKLMNISPITCESHAQILKLVDSTKECVRLLETLDLKVEGTADIILMFIIQFKLDSTTRGFDSNSQVLLCTALVNVCDSFGGTRLCRVLLDPGSQACLITSSCLERLGLPRKRTNVRISCLGASDTRTNGISEIKFTPHFTSNISFVTSVYVVNKIVGQLPHFSLDSSWSEPFSDLKLANPTFFKSGPIDIFIGVNIALPMLKGQSLSFGDNKPFAVRSDLGWIVAGNVPSEDMFSSIAVNSIQVVTDELVSNFWKLDSVPEASLLTSEERACEDHFIDTHVRNEDGRYVARLPFHSSPSKLGDSRESAIRRFKSLEHSLIKKPAIYSQYRDFMQEYLTLGHMELVPKNDYAKREAYYLPHHAVLRDSSTTKLRVVFDASAKSTSGYSLNDILMVGPRVQRDVYPILLSFRTFQIAVCADLEKDVPSNKDLIGRYKLATNSMER
ncbi:DUF1758 domain-containing protein, partial [Trichonephila clavipes]